MTCPCGRGQPYETCCGRFHGGVAAPTAVDLMRARYSAYVMGDDAFIGESWDPATCPDRLSSDRSQTWNGLEVVDHDGGSMFDQTGTVSFRASFSVGGELRELRETSRFRRVDGRWVYVDALDAVIVPADE